MALVRRQKSGGKEIPPVVVEFSGGPLDNHPSVGEWLTASTWPDGSPRETGTLMLFVEDGRWKAWLHDRDAKEGCFVSSPTVRGLLDAIEALLETGGGDWRADKKGGKR